MRRIQLAPQKSAPALCALLTFATALSFCFLAASRLSDLLIYNASASMPRGFYIRMQSPIIRDAIVTVRARDVAANYVSARGFADPNDRFLKRVAALDGDVVCALGSRVTINHTVILRRRTVDQQGRTLPTWSGCQRLNGQVFLIGDTADSFDGRYWGPVATPLIEGVWRPQ